MRKNVVLFLLLCLFSVSTYAKNINIGLFVYSKVTSINLKPIKGEYVLFLNQDSSSKVITIKRDEKIQIKVVDSGIVIKYKNQYLNGKEFKLKNIDYENQFLIQSYNNKNLKLSYKGSIIIKNESGQLNIVNEINIEQYIEGVLYAEGGIGHHPEYYKVQAIISRTYAYDNLNKHHGDGYNLCSRVHCQAYKGNNYVNTEIRKAVHETEGLVLTDKNLDFITAAFYSNSGGQTENSEDVWLMPLPYLRSKKDSFSLYQPNYSWTKTISKDKWVKYLKKKSTISVENDSLLLFHQPHERTKYFSDEKYNILLKNIRKDWRLKSTNFSVEYTENEAILKGKGFGHGVGLSQEGAMNMANKNFTFEDILIYYYSNINIIPVNLIDFYKE